MSMTPDSRMVRKIQNYDKDLFVKWNNRKEYFELWRKQAVGSVLITPVTKQIYFEGKAGEFTSLDERLLWWIYDADSWAHGGPKEHCLKMDSRWKAKEKRKYEAGMSDFKYMAKEAWHALNNKFTKTYAKKDKRFPSFNSKKHRVKWTPPDSQSRTSSRLMSRSPQNAKVYNYDPN